MQALEAIKILSDYGQAAVNKLMMFDGATGNWQTFKVSKNVNCGVCGSGEPI
jgi:adenylyltransferase/sulfurtransferase